MHYDTETKMHGQRNAITPLLTSTDLQTTKRLPDNMSRDVENFCRMSANKASMKGKCQVRSPADEIVRKLFRVALMLGIGIAVVPTDATARTPIACGTIYTVAHT